MLGDKAGDSMARRKYEYWLTDEGQLLLLGWARDGLTDEQMARNMGVARKTLSAWKVKHEAIGSAIKQGKDVADYAVENALFRKCMAGDVTAIIYWLKNRQREKWRDRPDLTTEETLRKLDDVLGKIGGNI